MSSSALARFESTLTVADVPFRVSSLEHATAWLLGVLADSEAPRVAVRLANAYCVALASEQSRYGHLLASSGVNFPDGIPVVAVMRALGADSSEARRVRGPSFFREVLREGVPRNVRHFFLGSTPETLQALTDAVRRAYPGVQIAGSYSPPFGDVDEQYLRDLTERAEHWDADLVWVGMGTPKQDFVTEALASRAGVMAVGVGAAFDFVAGTVQEAPRWVQRSGFEWAYRLVKEPRRLWQRYVFGNGRFLRLAAQQLAADGRWRHLLNIRGLQRNGSPRSRRR